MIPRKRFNRGGPRFDGSKRSRRSRLDGKC
jgi:hypothetical protein